MSPDQYDKKSADDKKYQAAQDSRTLSDHAEITSHPPRHQAAVDHMQNQHDTDRMALRHAKRSLRKNVKDGLGKAFPKEEKSEPKEKKSPFEEAENGGNPMGKGKTGRAGGY